MSNGDVSFGEEVIHTIQNFTLPRFVMDADFIMIVRSDVNDINHIYHDGAWFGTYKVLTISNLPA
jgi:hypothetical protein